MLMSPVFAVAVATGVGRLGSKPPRPPAPWRLPPGVTEGPASNHQTATARRSRTTTHGHARRLAGRRGESRSGETFRGRSLLLGVSMVGRVADDAPRCGNWQAGSTVDRSTRGNLAETLHDDCIGARR